jgi:hypothetical protein
MVCLVCQLCWQLSVQAAVTSSHRCHVTRTAITAVSLLPARGTVAARRPHPSDVIVNQLTLSAPSSGYGTSLLANVVASKSPQKDPGRLNARLRPLWRTRRQSRIDSPRVATTPTPHHCPPGREENGPRNTYCPEPEPPVEAKSGLKCCGAHCSCVTTHLTQI